MSPAFSKLSEVNYTFILEKMLGPSPTETMSTGGYVAFEGAVLEVVRMEAPFSMPMGLRSPRLKPTLVREAPKPKKYKQKRPMSMHESLRKHYAT